MNVQILKKTIVVHYLSWKCYIVISYYAFLKKELKTFHFMTYLIIELW